MIDQEFHDILKNYLSKLPAPDNDILITEFQISLQPGLVSFSGRYLLQDDSSLPIDIRQSKYQSGDFCEKICLFHKRSTDMGRNKWNRVSFQIDRNGSVKGEFLWDQKWEQENLDAYTNQSELERQKWYWEEE